MLNVEVIKKYGIGYEKGLKRCVNDAALYEAVLMIFLNDDTFERSKRLLAEKDFHGLFNCMHELKGAAGNAEITELYDAICPLVDALRCDDVNPDDVPVLYSKAESAYNKAKQGIMLASKE